MLLSIVHKGILKKEEAPNDESQGALLGILRLSHEQVNDPAKEKSEHRLVDRLCDHTHRHRMDFVQPLVAVLHHLADFLLFFLRRNQPLRSNKTHHQHNTDGADHANALHPHRHQEPSPQHA